MGVSKVCYNGKTLIDLTQDTVTESTLVSGATAHNMVGEEITGTVIVKAEQSKSFEATANGSYTVSPDNGKTLSSVAIAVNVTNTDTVDGLHLAVSSSAPTTNDTSIITFVV